MKHIHIYIAVSLTFLFALSNCKSEETTEKEIQRILDYLQYYHTFRLRLVELNKGAVVLERPFENGRIVPIPGIWRDYLNVEEWLEATKQVEIYFDDVEMLITNLPGIKSIKWQVASSEVVKLYDFHSPTYTFTHFIASLQYSDEMGLKECFVDSVEITNSKLSNLRNLIRLDQGVHGWTTVDDSTFAIATDSDKKIVFRLAKVKDQWKIAYIGGSH